MLVAANRSGMSLARARDSPVVLLQARCVRVRVYARIWQPDPLLLCPQAVAESASHCQMRSFWRALVRLTSRAADREVEVCQIDTNTRGNLRLLPDQKAGGYVKIVGIFGDLGDFTPIGRRRETFGELPGH